MRKITSKKKWSFIQPVKSEQSNSDDIDWIACCFDENVMFFSPFSVCLGKKKEN